VGPKTAIAICKALRIAICASSREGLKVLWQDPVPSHFNYPMPLIASEFVSLFTGPSTKTNTSSPASGKPGRNLIQN
jgi:hypothetical protein